MAQPQLNKVFTNLPKDPFDLFQKGNNIKGERIVKILQYKKKEFYQASGVKLSLIRYDKKMPKELKERMIEWATALNLVADFFQDNDKTIRWFFTPNPCLGEQTPRNMIRIGRAKQLMRFIRNALSENELTKKM